MDLSRFSIDAALFSGADASNAYRSIFFERLLAGLFEANENLFVRTDIQKEREQIFSFPALYWLTLAGHAALKGKALYLCIDEASAAAAHGTALRMAEGLTGTAKPVLLDKDNAGSEEVRNAQLLYGAVQTFHDLIPTGAFVPRDYGFVIADQADQMAELPGDLLRKLQGSLLPSWERKSLVIANKHTPRAKNFAWDFADNPKEMKLGEAMGYAGTTSTISREIQEADKIRFILHLLQEGKNHHICVFCNLKSMASELSARFVMNGVTADYIAGNLNPDRKNQIITKALTWTGQRGKPEPALAGDEVDASEAPAAMEVAAVPEVTAAAVPDSRFPADSFVLILTDEGAKGLTRPEFLNVVNYDIPLEPEFYFERLNFLKREDPEALLYNLVCERYMYGIPAIQRMVDASLSVAPLDANIELPKDMSAGRTIESPEPRFHSRFDRDRHGRDDRPGRDDRRDEGRRDESRREPQPAPRQDRPRQAELRRAEPREAEPRQAEPRKAETRQAGAEHFPVVDPYAMSMEERMALYRKKYGKRIEQKPAANGSRGDPRRKGRPESDRQDREGRSPERRNPERRRGPAARPSANPGMNAAKADKPVVEAKPQTPAPTPAPPKTETPPAGETPRGFFGRLQDLFGSRKE